MSKDFATYIKPDGPYYLTAVDRIEPYINELPCDMSAFESIDGALASRSSELYNKIEDYKKKCAKGSLYAIYRYVDQLKQTIIAKRLKGTEVLDLLHEKLEGLLVASKSELVSSLNSVKSNLMPIFDKWKDTVNPEHDREQVLRIYQTAYLTFKILHLLLDKLIFTVIPGVPQLRKDLLEMMDTLKDASEHFILSQEKAQKIRLAQEKEAEENKEREQEARKGIYDQLNGAIKRTKRHIEEKLKEEKKAFLPKLSKIELLISVIESLNQNDELETFWRVFGADRSFNQLIELFKLDESEREKWTSTLNFHIGKDYLSYIWNGANIDQDRVRREVIAATNRVLDPILVRGIHNTYAALLKFKRQYHNNALFADLIYSEGGVSLIERISGALSKKTMLLSPLYQLDDNLNQALPIDQEFIEQDGIFLFNAMMKEMTEARAQLMRQEKHLTDCLIELMNLKDSIQKKIKAPFDKEFNEIYKRLVEDIYFKIFREKGKGPTESLLQCLSETYPKMIAEIDTIKLSQKAMARQLNDTVASKRLRCLNQFMEKTAKSGWHWLFYWFSPTYHRYYDKVNQELVPLTQENHESSLSIFDKVSSILKTSPFKTWHWTPSAHLIKNMRSKMGETLFFSMESSIDIDVSMDTPPLFVKDS